jgi:hypothetical protein
MTRPGLVTVTSLALGLLAPACRDRGRSAGSAVTWTDPDAGDGGEGGRGLGRADNDPAVVALLKAALACKPSVPCTGALAWDGSEDEFVHGRADPTLVSLLEDPDERVRVLAARKLARHGAPFRTERALAERVVAAAEAERGERAAPLLGGLVARVELLARRHPLAVLREAVVEGLFRNNPSSVEAFDLTKNLVGDPDHAVRVAAVGAFWVGGDHWSEETCRFWFDHIDDPRDEDVAARASELLTRSGRCQAETDALLESAEKRFRAARTDRPAFAAALRNVCEDRKSTDAERARAGALARRLVQEKSIETAVRVEALPAVLACDPAGGRAFVNGFATDKDPEVRDRAVGLLLP